MALRLNDAVRNALMRSTGDDLDTTMSLGFIFIYSGAQPASANDAATGTLLAVIANDDGATGLLMEDAAAVGAIQKTASETWSGAGVAAGVAGWFRFQALDVNKATTQVTAAAASTTKARFDGAIAASGAELNTSNTNIVVSALQTINTYTLTLPANL
jgi:hypothetical protein